MLVRRKNISQDNEAISSEDSKMADYYLEIFHEILMDMNFQKYESFAHVLLDSPFLATILQDLTIRPWSSQCWTQSIEIQSKIV